MLQELGKLPRSEVVEQILAVLVQEGLIEREEHQGPAPDHPRIRLTRTGRKTVRDALGLTREPFTFKQRRLITGIVSAGLAPQADVEAAFRDREGGSTQIEAWRKILSERASATFAERLDQEQAYMENLTRWEPCAYPGCTEKIEVRTTWLGGKQGNEEQPEPVRFMQLTEQLPGWHEESRAGIRVLVPNTRTTLIDLYACSPTHREGVYRLVGQVTLSIDPAEEQRLQALIYPWSSDEARNAIWLRAKSDALDYVASAPLGVTFPSPKAWAQINKIGQSCLAAFKASTMAEPANAGKQFTDDEEALTKRYLEMFRLEFKSGLTIREAILAPTRPGSFSSSYHNDSRWGALYALLEKQKKQ